MKENDVAFWRMGGHGLHGREEVDYYATDPVAIERLLPYEHFSKKIWEPACGQGHLSEALVRNGHEVLSTDLIDRGYGIGGIDFLEVQEKWDGDIITNPPYKIAQQFCEHAIELIDDGHKVAMFLSLQFLEGVRKRRLFDKYPPKTVYVTSRRISCAKNGNFEKLNNGAQAYVWIVWEKPFPEQTMLRWFNGENDI